PQTSPFCPIPCRPFRAAAMPLRFTAVPSTTTAAPLEDAADHPRRRGVSLLSLFVMGWFANFLHSRCVGSTEIFLILPRRGNKFSGGAVWEGGTIAGVAI